MNLADFILADLADAYGPPKTDLASPQPTVTKIGHNLLVSREMLMDAGVIEDTRPPVKIPRRILWRIRRQAWVERQRERLASRLVGYDVTDHY